MQKKQFIVTYRLFSTLLVVVAIAAQLAYNLQAAVSFSMVNFFSFFTIESNLFAAVIFLMSAYSLARRKDRDVALDSLRGAATLYMVTTGIIYSILLSGAEVQTALPLVNSVLHYLFPVVVLFDWLYDHFKRKFALRDVLLWLVYPLLYAVYTLVRGPFAHDWYPYPFINAALHGYTQVTFNCAVITVAVVVLAMVVAKLSDLFRPKSRSVTR